MDCFIGEIRLASFNFAPAGWALCDGQILPISQNQALFALLGTNFGGNGVTTFALPDLRSRSPRHPRANNGNYPGEIGGARTHQLTAAEMAAHRHVPRAGGTADSVSPQNAYFAARDQPAFAATSNTTLAASAIAATGESEEHENMPPYLVVNFMIALAGSFPSRQ